MSWAFIGRVLVALLTGAGISALVVGSLIWASVLLPQVDSLNLPMVLMLPFTVKLTFVFSFPVHALNAPVIFLFAYAYRGPLLGGLSIGAVIGAIEGYSLAASFGRANSGGNEILAFIGATSGVIVAWRVLAQCRRATMGHGSSPPTPTLGPTMPS